MSIERFYVHDLTRLRAPVVDGRHGEQRDWVNAVETTGLTGWVTIGPTSSPMTPAREVSTADGRAFLPADSGWLETDRLRAVRNDRTYTFDFDGFISPKDTPTATHHLEADLKIVEG